MERTSWPLAVLKPGWRSYDKFWVKGFWNIWFYTPFLSDGCWGLWTTVEDKCKHALTKKKTSTILNHIWLSRCFSTKVFTQRLKEIYKSSKHKHFLKHNRHTHTYLCGPPQPWPVPPCRSGSGWRGCHRRVCVSYAPLCCRHCQSHPPGLLALGLGGWSLSQERSHLMDGRLILRLEIYRKSILLFQWSNIPTVNTPPPWIIQLRFSGFCSNLWACFHWRCRCRWPVRRRMAWWSHCWGWPSNHQAPDL